MCTLILIYIPYYKVIFLLIQKLRKKLAETGLLHFEEGAVGSINPDLDPMTVAGNFLEKS